MDAGIQEQPLLMLRRQMHSTPITAKRGMASAPLPSRVSLATGSRPHRNCPQPPNGYMQRTPVLSCACGRTSLRRSNE